MKLFNKQSGWLLGVAATLALASCQQDEVLTEVDETPGVEITAEDITTIEQFVYEYKGNEYSEAEWANYSEANGLDITSYYAAIVGDRVVVFDQEAERTSFEESLGRWMTGEVKGMPSELAKYDWLHAYSPKSAATEGNAQTSYYALLNWYIHKDYGGSVLHSIIMGDLYLEEKWWGWDIGNNVIEANLPSSYRNEVSSYKWYYMTLPSYGFEYCTTRPYRCYGTNTRYCRMEVKAHTGPLNDKGVSWTKDLYWNPSIGVKNTEEFESNWHDNRIWQSGGIPIWGDQVESYTVKFFLQ